MRIWNYPLEVTDHQTVELPPGAKILTVQMQGDTPCLWALVDDRFITRYPEVMREARVIAIYGTGNPMPDEPGDYLATFQMHGGALVFHAFELK